MGLADWSVLASVSGEKAQAQISPKKGLRLVAEISTYILASSRVQLPALFDFQQIGQ